MKYCSLDVHRLLQITIIVCTFFTVVLNKDYIALGLQIIDHIKITLTISSVIIVS